MSYKIWVIVSAGLFILSIALGVCMALFMPTLAYAASPIAEELMEQLASLLADSRLLTAIFILFNNAFTLVISFILSPILCLFPVMVLVVNGWFIGFLSPGLVSESSIAFLLSGLLPHGVIELPAIIMGEAAALSFGVMSIILLVKKDYRTVLVRAFTRNTGRILLSILLFFVIGPFHTIIVLGLLEEETRVLLLTNLKRNLLYLAIALALLLPAAFIEIYFTPLLLT